MHSHLRHFLAIFLIFTLAANTGNAIQVAGVAFYRFEARLEPCPPFSPPSSLRQGYDRQAGPAQRLFQ